jgi:hypothetical protein
VLCNSRTKWSGPWPAWRGVLGRARAAFAAAPLLLALPRCDSTYPVAATLCDQWCAAENRLQCGDNADPLRCVLDCEQWRRTDSGEWRGVAGRCDGPRHELLQCIQALPDAAFSCREGRTHRDESTCIEATLLLTLCASRDTTTWEDLCSDWARTCANRSGGAGPDPWSSLYRKCTDPYHYAPGLCTIEQREFIGCLRNRELPCDSIPSRTTVVCRAERSALDACDPRLSLVCTRWARECLVPGDGGPPSADPVQAAMTCRTTAIVAEERCRDRREDLYDCLTGPWYDDHVLRCDDTPIRAPECEVERVRLEACAMSSPNDGS